MSTPWYVVRIILLWFILVYGFALVLGDIGTYEIETITLVVAVVAVWRRTRHHRQRTV